MSQATASVPWPGRNRPSDTTPHLEAVPRVSRHARPRLFYAAIAVLTVMVVVVTQLLLSIGVSQGAYRIESLQSRKGELARAYQAVSEDVDALSSPQNLAANAAALGMVNNGTPVYLRLSDGKIIGSPAPATAAAGSTGQLVGNALTQDIPLVTAPKTTKQARTPADQGAQASRGATGTEPAAGAAGGTDSGTPGANRQKTNDGPVPWTGALPAPSTH